MAKASTPKERQSGSLRRVTKTAKGKEYPRWQWRTHRETETGWKTVYVELGDELTGLRTRTLIALGELSAPVLVERWTRWYFRSWSNVLPAFTGRPDGAKQDAAWWCVIPKRSDESVRIRFRSMERGIDFRRDRASIKKAEAIATDVWRRLSDDPIIELGRQQWVEGQAQIQLDKISEWQVKLRKQKRSGELSQRDFEADERTSYMKLETWETVRSTVRTRWDEQLKAIVDALPRPRREELKARIVLMADRMQSDSRQLSQWRDDCWIDNTLHW